MKLEKLDNSSFNIEVRQPASPPPATPRELRNLARRLRRICDLIDDGQGITLDQLEITQLVTGLTKVEKLLKRRKGPTDLRKRKPKPLDLDDDHITILKWINERRFAATGHVQTYLLVKNATARLLELEKAKYLTALRYERHKGLLSEKVYWLSSRGANLLMRRGIKARSETRFRHSPPDENRVHFGTMELELPHQARLANWKVIEPQIFNASNRKGDRQTDQTTAIANALHRREERQLQEAKARGDKKVTARQEAFKRNEHLLGIPLQLNHHVCYRLDSEAVMIFILCQPEITGQFLEARLKEYEELAKRVKVWTVFYSKEFVEVWTESINAANFGITTLASLPDLFRDYSPEMLGKIWGKQA